MQEKSHGIILRVTRLTDTSSIIRWWTLEHGLIETVAKGARRSNSPFAGKIDLFFSANMTWQRAKTGSLHHLKEVAVQDYREGLRLSYDRTLMAAYFCAWLEKICEPEHPEPEVYDLLTRGLDYLTTSEASTRAMIHYERQLAKLHGVAQSGSDALMQLADLGTNLPIMRNELLDRLAKKGSK